MTIALTAPIPYAVIQTTRATYIADSSMMINAAPSDVLDLIAAGCQIAGEAGVTPVVITATGTHTAYRYTYTSTSPFCVKFGDTIYGGGPGAYAEQVIFGSDPDVTSIDFGTLVGSIWAFSGDTANSLTSLSAPNLAISMSSVNIEFTAMTSISFPKLAIVGDGGTNGALTFTGNTALVSAHFPSLVASYGGGAFDGCTALTDLSFGPNLAFLKGGLVATGCALTQASVDGILASLVALGTKPGTYQLTDLNVDLSGGTSAAPSTAGAANKAILVGQGCTVTTN